MQPFKYERPTSLDDALHLLQVYGDGARLLNGGTDLAVGLTTGRVTPSVVIDIKRVSELAPQISTDGQRITISANTVMADIVRHPVVASRLPTLVEAAVLVGSIQVRHRATLPGNICNASPAADTAPPLLVYGATVHIAGPSGRRELLYDDFVLGPRRTALASGEIVVALSIPLPPAGLGSAFRRVTRRRGVDLATLSVACTVDPQGVTRLAYGAVGPRPFLVVDDTGVLADPGAAAVERDRRLAELLERAAPISDIRATRDYRLAMLRVHSRRALASALARQTNGERDGG